MDDFGTGYSSLSYLRSFPFDKIKIDQSFVRDLGANREAQAIIRAIISLGKGLGVTITAEGVETEAELSCLRAEGCHEGQGFLFSRARPNAEIISLLTAQRGAKSSVSDGGKRRWSPERSCCYSRMARRARPQVPSAHRGILEPLRGAISHPSSSRQRTPPESWPHSMVAIVPHVASSRAPSQVTAAAAFGLAARIARPTSS